MFYVRQKASPFGDEEVTQTAGRRHHSFRRWMHHEPLPDLWQAGDVENSQPAVANLSRNCVCRDNAIPRPAITACLIVSLDPISMPMRGSNAMLGQESLRQQARPGANLAHQNGLLGDLSRRDRTLLG
jgi:hypothetical protein